MRYIVPCSSCGTELRIPLDLGKLTVRCPRCYHSFVFDPEDSASFRGGRYDTPGQGFESESPRSLRSFFHFLSTIPDRIKSKFGKNQAHGWESPSQSQNRSRETDSFSPRPSFGPIFAKYILFALILIGIARACFYSRENYNPYWEKSPTSPEQTPNPPGTREEDPPQVEI